MINSVVFTPLWHWLNVFMFSGCSSLHFAPISAQYFSEINSWCKYNNLNALLTALSGTETKRNNKILPVGNIHFQCNTNKQKRAHTHTHRCKHNTLAVCILMYVCVGMSVCERECTFAVITGWHICWPTNIYDRCSSFCLYACRCHPFAYAFYICMCAFMREYCRRFVIV